MPTYNPDADVRALRSLLIDVALANRILGARNALPDTPVRIEIAKQAAASAEKRMMEVAESMLCSVARL